MYLGTAPGSSAQSGPPCRLERGHMGIGASAGPRVQTNFTFLPSKPHPLSWRVFPQPGVLSCIGPSSPSSLPCSQRVPVNPGGHTHSPSWSWQTPPCRQPGHSLAQPGPQSPASQPEGMCFQQLTLSHLTTAAKDWGCPGTLRKPTELSASHTSHTSHHLCPGL